MEIVYQCLKKLKVELLYDLEIPLLGLYTYIPKRIETKFSKRYLYTQIYSSIIHNIQKMKNPTFYQLINR